MQDGKLLTPPTQLRPSVQLRKLSLNVPGAIAERLRKLAFDNSVSESSVVEIALRAFFQLGDSEQLGAHLRHNGATLRRK